MDLHEIQVGCRTYRRFLQEPVSEEALKYALENARIASCGMNAQSLRYVAVTSREKVAAMQPLVKWAAALPPELGTPKVGEQPTAFIVISGYGTLTKVFDIDLGIATHSIVTSLYEKGYGSCIMQNIQPDAIHELLGLNEKEVVRMVIAIGKPSHKATIVPMKDNEFKYYLDEERNYYVPKRAFEDVVTFQ